MSDQFFKQPILNSPYGYPSLHWELDEKGQPTQKIVESRRASSFISPIPKPRRHHGEQTTLALDEVENLSDDGQRYRHSELINSVRREVDAWRRLPPSQWRVTPETARLLEHWRNHKFAGVRPFWQGHGVQETPEPRMRRPSCPLLEARAEVLQDESDVNMDESSCEVSGMRNAAGALCVAQGQLLQRTVRQAAR